MTVVAFAYIFHIWNVSAIMGQYINVFWMLSFSYTFKNEKTSNSFLWNKEIGLCVFVSTGKYHVQMEIMICLLYK